MLLALHRQATRSHRPSMAMPLAAAPYRASGLVLWRKADNRKLSTSVKCQKQTNSQQINARHLALKRRARRSGDHHTSARNAADYSPVDAGPTSRVAVGPTLNRDGSRRSTLSQTNRTIRIHIMSTTRNYLDSKPVNSSVAFELRTSSICRDSTRALAFKASIVELWGCNFSSSSIRLLNDASSSRSRSISALRLSNRTGFQTLCARMMRPLLWSRLRELHLWP